MTDYKTITETNNFIVLDHYSKIKKIAESYQSEDALERELIRDLKAQGYEYLPDLNSPQAMRDNVRTQLQALNSVEFTDGEWLRFVESYLGMQDGRSKVASCIASRVRKVNARKIASFSRCALTSSNSAKVA